MWEKRKGRKSFTVDFVKDTCTFQESERRLRESKKSKIICKSVENLKRLQGLPFFFNFN